MQADLDTLTQIIWHDYGYAIRTLRKAKGWTQSDLAERLNVNRITVSNMEKGAHGTSIDTVMRSLAWLGYKTVIVPKNFKMEMVSD